MRNRISILAIALLALASCSPKTEQYVDFLYEYMPLPDSLTYPREYWVANVEKTLEVRKEMGWNVPEREFKHFVLPLRVNNENLDDFRTDYADELCARVKGMTMTEAALEINHWCHERVTYQPSDARTSGPEAAIANGLGRCGEESVLTVSALRAAGLPARQVYTPRWAHTDDNHAWVEVWADGGWHFLGACEPEAVLDKGWFNAPVSRAMILHTKVFGDYKGDEDLIVRTPNYTEINVIRGYVPARRSTVKVVDEAGKAVEGARIQFKIYNYAEFYPFAEYKTDAKGCASLDMGLGDMLAWASKDGKFGWAKVDGEAVTLVLNHNVEEGFSEDIDIVPPVENPLPSKSTPEQDAANAIRLAYEDSIRNAAHPVPYETPDLAGASELLLSTISAKDHHDISKEVVEDANDLIMGPRIELEFLRPYAHEIRAALEGQLSSPSEVVTWVRDSIALVEGRNSQGLRTPPISSFRARKADRRGRNLLYVAVCRSLGFPARIEAETGKVQYQSNGVWVDVDLDDAVEIIAPQGTLLLSWNGKIPVFPDYYTHFTISRLDDGMPVLLEYPEDGGYAGREMFGKRIALDEGDYLLTTGTRLADGGVLAHVESFHITAGENTCAEVVLRNDPGRISVVGHFDADRFLPLTGRGYFLIAALGVGDEPTIHALRQLAGISEALNEWGRAVLIYGHGTEKYESFLSGIDKAVFMTDDSVREMLSGCSVPAHQLPFVAVADSFGRVVFFSEGYNTSLGERLTQVISAL